MRWTTVGLACVTAALASALRAAGDDPVRAKLEEAKAAYGAALEKHRAAVAGWFDQREAAARLNGDQKGVDQVKAERQAFEAKGELPKSAPAPLTSQPATARSALADAYTTAIKEYAQTKQDDKASATERELEVFRATGQVRAAGPDGRELLRNPGCEERPTKGGIPGWREVRGKWMRRTEDPQPREGNLYFSPRPGPSAELAQDVSVTALAQLIDQGQQRFEFRGFVRSWKGQRTPDTSRIMVEYRSGPGDDGKVLDRFDSGPIGNTNAWQKVADRRAAPTGTRVIRVRLISVRHEGNDNDGYYDDLSLRALAR